MKLKIGFAENLQKINLQFDENNVFAFSAADFTSVFWENAELNEGKQSYSLKIAESESRIDVDVGEVYVRTEDVEYYSGDYKVTPTIENQILKTKDKLMVNDFTVNAIPYSEVSNLAGGKTAAIG